MKLIHYVINNIIFAAAEDCNSFNFQSLDVVSRYRYTQLQVTENYAVIYTDTTTLKLSDNNKFAAI